MLARASSGWLLRQLAPALLPALGCRLLATSVAVPPMGDSITEGSISAVLKQAGDAVAENEVIAQIETDKVVIDIKAPEAGVLESVLVKPDDVVNPGAPVAVIIPGAAPAAAPSSQPATSAAPAPTPAPPAATTAPAPAASTTARPPGISFPLRMTPDGTRISTLPASEAAAYQRQHAAAASPPSAAATPAAPGPSPSAPQPGTKPKTVLSTAPPPPRRQLTEREMEIIELGGALP